MKAPTTPSYPIVNGALAAAAEVALDRLGVSEGDAFLVVSNPELVEIATELADAARARTQNLRIQEFPPTSRDGEEPPDVVATAMSQASAIAMVTRGSLSHTQARMTATRAGARIASMPGITLDIFARTIPIDYPHLERVGRALTGKLSEANVCRVSAPGGTDVELLLHGREAICDDGDLLRPGAWGNLPAGEAFIAPLEMGGAGRSSSTARSPAGDSSTSRCRSSSRRDERSVQRAVPRPSGCSRHSRPAAKTAGRSPSWESARIRAQRSPVQSSRTRRRKGRFT